MSALKLVFAGTPEFAARHLQALLASEHAVCAVYTQPDRPAGRGKKLTPSPVKALALGRQLPILQPATLKTAEARAQLVGLAPDLMVVVAYGLLLPPAILEAPRFGCINVHASILPRWRGAAPIQRAIEAGDTSSGVTVMQMDSGLDTGDMLLKRACPISPTDTAANLHDRLCDIGPLALLETLRQIADGATRPEPQKHQLSTYASKITKQEAKIDWRCPAASIALKIRAFNPFPICFSNLRSERLRIHQVSLASDQATGAPGQIVIHNSDIVVQCGEGQLKLEKLQLPGTKPMTAREFINGFSDRLLADDTPIRLGES